MRDVAVLSISRTAMGQLIDPGHDRAGGYLPANATVKANEHHRGPNHARHGRHLPLARSIRLFV